MQRDPPMLYISVFGDPQFNHSAVSCLKGNDEVALRKLYSPDIVPAASIKYFYYIRDNCIKVMNELGKLGYKMERTTGRNSYGWMMSRPASTSDEEAKENCECVLNHYTNVFYKK